MFTIHDNDAGLSLVMERDPAPRNPRLVEESLFTLITWTRDLGDAHTWPDQAKFHAAVRPDTHLIYPLVRVETSNGPILLRQAELKESPAIGYAIASFDALSLHFGLDRLTAAIRDEVIAEAEALCLGELQALDDYTQGEVYRFSILDRNGEVLEIGRDLYGEDLARHMASQAFEAHLFGVKMDG